MPIFLKTFLGGQLMSVVGRDGNDQMYESWKWFLSNLQIGLELDKLKVQTSP